MYRPHQTRDPLLPRQKAQIPPPSQKYMTQNHPNACSPIPREGSKLFLYVPQKQAKTCARLTFVLASEINVKMVKIKYIYNLITLSLLLSLSSLLLCHYYFAHHLYCFHISLAYNL